MEPKAEELIDDKKEKKKDTSSCLEQNHLKRPKIKTTSHGFFFSEELKR